MSKVIYNLNTFDRKEAEQRIKEISMNWFGFMNILLNNGTLIFSDVYGWGYNPTDRFLYVEGDRIDKMFKKYFGVED